MHFKGSITPTLLLSTSVLGQVYLSPDQPILHPDSESATNPLAWLGGNGPYLKGPDVNGVTNEVPEGCTVEQVAYVARHGSRYPDTGAYNGWVSLHTKIQAAKFTGSGSLAFLNEWKPVLTNPSFQIAAQSPTGWVEAFSMGYRLRTKYPELYQAGDKYYAWANLYARVVATAQNFVRGFLGENAATLGQVITVDAKGSANALFDSLGPSDMCPNYRDENGGTFGPTWDSIYLPPITARLNALLKGDLVLTDNDVSGFPYLCGFESQITGVLSPWCSVFTNEELKQYEYRQDLRYYYGSGPGTDLPSKMMLPFLNRLVEILADGPNQNMTIQDGSSVPLPKILAMFANDGQMTQLNAALGVWDDQTPLSATEIPKVWKYVASRFCSMRGTVAFERLSCKAPASSPSATQTTMATVTSASACKTAAPTCNRDNCFRQMLQNEDKVKPFCATFTQTPAPTATALPTFVSACQNLASRVSSACSCIAPATTSCATPTATPTPGNGKKTYVRILINDAVYPVVGCDNGPGKSCEMKEYKEFVAKRLEEAGDLKERCAVTQAGVPEKLQGASFLKDLRGDWLASVKP